MDGVPTNGSKIYIMNYKDYKNVSTCNWDLRPNDNPGNGANSPTFVLDPTPRATPSTLALAQSTATSSSATSSPTTISTPTDTPAPASASAHRKTHKRKRRQKELAPRRHSRRHNRSQSNPALPRPPIILPLPPPTQNFSSNNAKFPHPVPPR